MEANSNKTHSTIGPDNRNPVTRYIQRVDARLDRALRTLLTGVDPWTKEVVNKDSDGDAANLLDITKPGLEAGLMAAAPAVSIPAYMALAGYEGYKNRGEHGVAKGIASEAAWSVPFAIAGPVGRAVKKFAGRAAGVAGAVGAFATGAYAADEIDGRLLSDRETQQASKAGDSRRRSDTASKRQIDIDTDSFYKTIAGSPVNIQGQDYNTAWEAIYDRQSAFRDPDQQKKFRDGAYAAITADARNSAILARAKQLSQQYGSSPTLMDEFREQYPTNTFANYMSGLTSARTTIQEADTGYKGPTYDDVHKGKPKLAAKQKPDEFDRMMAQPKSVMRVTGGSLIDIPDMTLTVGQGMRRATRSEVNEAIKESQTEDYGIQQASKAGDSPRRTDLSNFLATDEVPEALFGIPVVASPEQYTESDIAFFEEHPRAGGFYELGDEDTDTQAAEGGGDTFWNRLKRAVKNHRPAATTIGGPGGFVETQILAKTPEGREQLKDIARTSGSLAAGALAPAAGLGLAGTSAAIGGTRLTTGLALGESLDEAAGEALIEGLLTYAGGKAGERVMRFVAPRIAKGLGKVRPMFVKGGRGLRGAVVGVNDGVYVGADAALRVGDLADIKALHEFFAATRRIPFAKMNSVEREALVKATGWQQLPTGEVVKQLPKFEFNPKMWRHYEQYATRLRSKLSEFGGSNIETALGPRAVDGTVRGAHFEDAFSGPGAEQYFKYYPDARKYVVRIERNPNPKLMGEATQGKILITKSAMDRGVNQVVNTMHHEPVHVIQADSGLSRGGNLSAAGNVLHALAGGVDKNGASFTRLPLKGATEVGVKAAEKNLRKMSAALVKSRRLVKPSNDPTLNALQRIAAADTTEADYFMYRHLGGEAGAHAVGHSSSSANPKVVLVESMEEIGIDPQLVYDFDPAKDVASRAYRTTEMIEDAVNKRYLDLHQNVKGGDTRRDIRAAEGAEGTSEELPRYYKVQPGDNLAKIARATRVSSANIAKYSKLADPNKIHPGQMLLLTEPYPGKWNNPGNVRWNSKVVREGETGKVKSKVSDGYFLTFDTPQNGLNAQAQVIGAIARSTIPKRYQEGKLPNAKFTISNLINVYAPPNDKNDTPGYIKFVAAELGVDKDAELNIDDAKQMSSLLRAIVTRDSKPEYAEWFRDSEYAEAVKNMKTPVKVKEGSGKKGK